MAGRTAYSRSARVSRPTRRSVAGSDRRGGDGRPSGAIGGHQPHARRQACRSAGPGRCSARRRARRSGTVPAAVPIAARRPRPLPTAGSRRSRLPYVIRSPSASSTTTYRVPATLPVNDDGPAATTVTRSPADVPYSMPAIPGTPATRRLSERVDDGGGHRRAPAMRAGAAATTIGELSHERRPRRAHDEFV